MMTESIVPAASMGLPEESHHLVAFEVKVPNDVPEGLLRPLQSDPDYHSDSKVKQRYLLSDKRAVRVNIKLSISAATKDAELGAVTKLFSNPNQDRTEKQHAAFHYLLDFKNPRFMVNMFNHFPHLRDPLNNPVDYKNVLSNLPCGICIIPGGPRAGKTHWNLVLRAAIQSKDMFWYGPDNMSRRSARVLYILDINKPLDDTSNKIVRLYKSLGLNKFAVRLNGWHYKGNGMGGIDFTSKFLFIACLSRYRRQTFSKTCLAPTLDELAWDLYDANKTTKYVQLYSLLARVSKSGSEAKSEEFKGYVDRLYRDVLAGAIRLSLLINHRASGGLQLLASSMFNNEKMVSGHSGDELFMPPVQHLQRFLERFMDPGSKCREPRLNAFSPNRGEARVGTSWFNADHMNWVMDRVGELPPDPMFRQVGKTDRGTILIAAPYKEAYMKHKKAIQNLPKAWAARLGVERRLEVRTIDTVQGGEADFVFLDLVRSAATDFTDDPNRLCVALTRARQAEVVLMHPGTVPPTQSHPVANIKVSHLVRDSLLMSGAQASRIPAGVLLERNSLRQPTTRRVLITLVSIMYNQRVISTAR
ncbi:Regulator of nonsense transcripts 1 [Cytospora mali]|uniref:Regulator of nonsense transcripts 1 n=1 Tax=Cytospora mali TaxID=578113 RepID=A0A194WDY8_CYTMA|nr:Regulator of nonsense transcripts 1 [Valsa mali]